ncbi:MAG TPA: MOSC domain-containing protein [Thermomicrobiales bacterium]|nr:MOSC domain-containing protein [Thermomicrobiales bacterium]
MTDTQSRLATRTITLLSTSVGKPAFLGMRRGEEVISGIRKKPVDAPAFEVTTLNIAGDGQADLVNHGGVNKAIYSYPAQHLVHWRETLGYQGDGIHALMGENLSLAGIDETTACIGDIWRWGDVILQISQPRWPCYKLDMLTGIKGMMTKLIKSGYSGWYFRVLEPGTAPASGEIEIVERDPLGITVLEAFNARRDPKLDPDEYARIMSHPKLAEAWNR